MMEQNGLPTGLLQARSIVSLKKQKEKIEELLILSHDPSLYLVQVKIGECYFRVVDNEGVNLVFRNQQAAKKEFEGLSVARAMLVHQSSYDEMVGQSYREQSNMLRVPVSLPMND